MLVVLVVITLAALAGFSPVPELGFILQLTGLGTGIGMVVALYLDRRDPDAERWRRVVAGFSAAGLSLGALLVLVDAIVTAL